jgi:hypothetical protein
METTPMSTTAPAMASAPTSTPAPVPAMASAPMSTPAPSTAPMVNMGEGGTPMMENGGNTDSVGGFFKSLNPLEIGFAILGVASLSYVIYYYRFKLQQDKLINNEMQRQLDELKMNLQTKMQGKYKTI